MADNSTQIDELRLDITVEDKTSGESSDKKVKNLATAISRLNKNLQAFDNKKMSSVFANMTKGIDPFVQKIGKVSGALNSLATIVSKMKLDKAVEETTKSISPLQKETVSGDGRAETKIQAQQGTAQQLEQIQNIAKSTSSSILGITTKVEILKKKLEMVNAELQKDGLTEKQLVQLKTQQLSIQEQINKAEGKKPRVPLSNLLKSFGRIAMYRAIRTVIKEITQAFMESVDGIAKYNDEFRSTMGNVQSSMAKAKASIGVAFYQVLILIEPLITQLANGIANLANSLAKVTANMRGVANYTKINTEYMKEYKSATQGTLLAFDTFTTLSSNQQYDPSKMFKNASDALDVSQFSEGEKTLKTLMQTLGEIWEIIKELYKTIEPLLTKIINDLLPPVMDLLKQIVKVVDLLLDIFGDALDDVVDFIGAVVRQISGAVQMISGILKLLTGDFDGAWKDIANGFANMVNGIVNMFISLANFIIDILNVIRKPIGKIFGKDYEIKDITWRMDWKPYANGGIYNSADMFYANENGKTELIASSNNGGGAVMNLEQWQQISEMSFYNALVKYGACQNGQISTIDMNKLGTAIASNTGFRNEANRRNAGLNWK